MQWWLRGCPKCRGDCFEDLAGNMCDIKCLQCGRTLSPAERKNLGVHAPHYGVGPLFDLAEEKTKRAA